MMTMAFAIAIKGTIKRAVMLGLAAMLPHTTVAWPTTLGDMYIGKTLIAQAAEPWLRFASATIIPGTAPWMFWRTWQREQNWLIQMHHDHGHGHHHHHDHDGHHHNHDDDRHHCHHHHHHYHYHGREHNHDHAALAGLTEGSKRYQDVYERAHIIDTQRYFTSKEITNGRILLLGLTGGLIPCPAAVTVLLIRIQLRAFALGAIMALYFSFGLALALVTVGVEAVISVQQAAKRWSGFNTMTCKAPYFSSAFIAMVGLYMGIHGYMGTIS